MGKTFRNDKMLDAMDRTRSSIAKSLIGRSGSGAHKSSNSKDQRRLNRLDARDAKRCNWENYEETE